MPGCEVQPAFGLGHRVAHGENEIFLQLLFDGFVGIAEGAVHLPGRHDDRDLVGAGADTGWDDILAGLHASFQIAIVGGEDNGNEAAVAQFGEITRDAIGLIEEFGIVAGVRHADDIQHEMRIATDAVGLADAHAPSVVIAAVGWRPDPRAVAVGNAGKSVRNAEAAAPVRRVGQGLFEDFDGEAWDDRAGRELAVEPQRIDEMNAVPGDDESLRGIAAKGFPDADRGSVGTEFPAATVLSGDVVAAGRFQREGVAALRFDGEGFPRAAFRAIRDERRQAEDARVNPAALFGADVQALVLQCDFHGEISRRRSTNSRFPVLRHTHDRANRPGHTWFRSADRYPPTHPRDRCDHRNPSEPLDQRRPTAIGKAPDFLGHVRWHRHQLQLFALDRGAIFRAAFDLDRLDVVGAEGQDIEHAETGAGTRTEIAGGFQQLHGAMFGTRAFAFAVHPETCPFARTSYAICSRHA